MVSGNSEKSRKLWVGEKPCAYKFIFLDLSPNLHACGGLSAQSFSAETARLLSVPRHICLMTFFGPPRTPACLLGHGVLLPTVPEHLLFTSPHGSLQRSLALPCSCNLLSFNHWVFCCPLIITVSNRLITFNICSLTLPTHTLFFFFFFGDIGV
jgi:hypothetical protein